MVLQGSMISFGEEGSVIRSPGTEGWDGVGGGDTRTAYSDLYPTRD